EVVVEPLRVGGADVDAPVADISVPLVGHRPRRAVHEVAAVVELHRQLDMQAVTVGRGGRHTVCLGVHHNVGMLVLDVVGAVGGVMAGLAHRHRKYLLHVAVTRDGHLVGGVVGGGDQRVAGCEGGLGACRVDIHGGVGRPEVNWPPTQLAV